MTAHATSFDGVAFGRQMVEVVKAHVATTVGPLRKELDEVKAENASLRERLAALETRAAVPGPQGPAGPAGPPAPRGERGPAGEKGDVGPIGPAGPQGAKGLDGVPGKDGSVGQRGPQGERGDIGPMGKDGAKGIDGKDGAPGSRGERGEAGQPGVKGLDGVHGKDGATGRDGQPGVPGRDGKDGLGFDDLDVTYDGARTLTFRMARGERQKEASIVLPIVLDQGVWERDKQYVKGDAVTLHGSIWIAQADTKEKPGNGSTSWRLSVKRGADARGAP